MSRFSSHERFSYRDKRTSQKRVTRTILIVISLFVFYQLFNAIGLSSIKVMGNGMNPSLSNGDLILYRKYLFPSDRLLKKGYIKNGDVILINTPFSKKRSIISRSVNSIVNFLTFQKIAIFKEKYFWEKSTIFKRVILLPEDNLFNIENSNMIIPSNADYSMSEFESNEHDYDIIEHNETLWNSEYPLGSKISGITITPGKIWVLSDNRNFTNDSRSWHQADSTDIKGKALLCYWPIKNFGFIR